MLFNLCFVYGQNELFSEEEAQMKAGYELLLNGDPSQALDIFEKEIFDNGNYNAVPYYRLAYCAVPKDDAPSKKKINSATKLAKKSGNNWGASLKPKCFKKALDIIQQKADNGDAVAQCLLGSAYELGLLKKNKTLAFEYMSLAAEQGLTCAQYNLGLYYEKGFGVDKDLEMAITYIERSLMNSPHAYRSKYLDKLKSKLDKS